MVSINTPESVTHFNNYRGSDNPLSELEPLPEDQNSVFSEESIAEFSDNELNGIIANSINYPSSPGENQEYNCPIFKGGPTTGVREPVLVVPLAAGPLGPNHWLQRRVAIYMNKH